MRPRIIYLTAALGASALILASCATGNDGTPSAADGSSAALSECTQEAPDCNDAVGINTDDTGGELPVAPPADSSVSGGMIVDGGLSIDEAMAYEGSEVVAVSGYFVSIDGEARLCSALAESFPPQCGGDSLTIANPEALASSPLVEEGTTQWSEETITVLGTIDGDTLTVDVTSA